MRQLSRRPHLPSPLPVAVFNRVRLQGRAVGTFCDRNIFNPEMDTVDLTLPVASARPGAAAVVEVFPTFVETIQTLDSVGLPTGLWYRENTDYTFFVALALDPPGSAPLVSGAAVESDQVRTPNE